jgi:Asp-tRNA(Asn)/Glu-tRNA(Gln) amidotransferase A subunit family amidase
MKPSVRPFVEATEKFRSGADTPRKFLDRCLETLEIWEPKISAFVTLNLPAARAAADRSTERWAAGKPLSAIDGMPVGIKDIIETADMPTEMGSPLMKGWKSQKDSASVAALRAAGAIILGKTTTTEFAMSHPFHNTRNPLDLTRTPGGSSSGSAASVGAGIVTAALGTQVIGSGLRPASYCGAFGFKPSVHGINRTGSHDPQSQSCTAIIAATLADTWQVAYEIVKRAGGDPGYAGVTGPDKLPAAKKPKRLAFLETAGWAGATEEAKRAFGVAVEKIKAAGVEVIDRRSHANVDAIEADIADAMAFSLKFSDWEMRWFISSLAERGIEQMSQSSRDRFKIANAMTIEDYRTALGEREEIRADYHALASECDGCITLTASGAAPVGTASTGSPVFAVPASLLGTPALSLPVLQAEGLPLGLQFIGYADRDAEAFAVSAWLYDLLAK